MIKEDDAPFPLSLQKSSLSDGSTLDVEMYLEKQDQVRQLEDEKASYSSLILDLQEMLEEKETHLSNYKVLPCLSSFH